MKKYDEDRSDSGIEADKGNDDQQRCRNESREALRKLSTN